MSKLLRVLLIEDSEDDAVLLLRELRHGGYEPMYKRVDTKAAMNAALVQQTWDIVICDYSMPHFSAPAALKLLKESGLDLPFIIVSATIGEDTAVAAMKAGAHDYILKGNLARLVPAVERELVEAEVRLARQRAEEQLFASLQEKKVLLKEIHHRVKNNLQIISSLLNLQSEYIEDNKVLEIFKVSHTRIESMALIHEHLYQSENFATIDLADYVGTLVNHLLYSYKPISDKINIEININNVCLGIDEAVPCGLIINELVSNSLKHAFLPGKPGKICIKLFWTNEQKFILLVRDNGVGISEDFDFNNLKTLGLELVNLLTSQLSGYIELNRNRGTEFKITLPAVKKDCFV